MSDNVDIKDAGNNTVTIAADIVGGTTKYQRVKVAHGADGSATDTSAAAPFPVAQTGAVPAGTNNIGDVDVLTLPALPAGTNNIGDVDVLTVPADPFGANADAAVSAGATGSIQAKLRLMTSQLDAIKTAVETLDNAIAGSELQVDIVSGSSSGTEYTEGATDATITGTAVMWEDAADTLRAVSAAFPLPVDPTGATVGIEAGEAHVGEVGFSVAHLVPAFTMDTTPDYASGDVYGDKTTLTNAMRVSSGGGFLAGVTVVDVDGIAPTFDILIFDADPTATTWTDNSAPTVNATDAARLIASIPIPAALNGAAYADVGSWKVGTAPLDLAVKANGSANLYCVLIARAAINVATAGHLKLRFSFVRY